MKAKGFATMAWGIGRFLHRKQRWVLAMGLVLCFGVGWVLDRRGSQGQIRLVLLKRDLPSDHALTHWDMEFIPASDSNSRGITDQEVYLLKGGRTLRPLKRGSILQWEDVRLPPGAGGLGSAIPEGMRAYAFRPSNFVAAQFGDRLDIYWQRGVGKDVYALRENVPLLQAPRSPSEPYVVAVDPESIPLLEQGRVSGELVIALRSVHDGTEKVTSRARPRRPARRPAPAPQIWEIQ